MTATNAVQPSPRIESLFGPGVYAAELSGPGAVGQLFPAEAACLGNMVDARAAEFAAGRLCARKALMRLGITDAPIITTADRKPVWPEGVVGSITHTDGICGAVVARRGECLGLGLDMEVVGRVTEAIARRVCVPAELEWLEVLPTHYRPAARAVVFAAKEAFYKAQSPLTNEWLGFDALEVRATDMEVAMEEGATGTFIATPTRPLKLDHCVAQPLEGRFRLSSDLVAVGLALSRPDRRGTP